MSGVSPDLGIQPSIVGSEGGKQWQSEIGTIEVSKMKCCILDYRIVHDVRQMLSFGLFFTLKFFQGIVHIMT